MPQQKFEVRQHENSSMWGVYNNDMKCFQFIPEWAGTKHSLEGNAVHQCMERNIKHNDLQSRLKSAVDYSNFSIKEIAYIIYKHCKDNNQKAYAAQPYLVGMSRLHSINDMYGLDNGKSVVMYFLANAQHIKGGEMPAIKKELNRRLKAK